MLQGLNKPMTNPAARRVTRSSTPLHNAAYFFLTQIVKVLTTGSAGRNILSNALYVLARTVMGNITTGQAMYKQFYPDDVVATERMPCSSSSVPSPCFRGPTHWYLVGPRQYARPLCRAFMGRPHCCNRDCMLDMHDGCGPMCR